MLKVFVYGTLKPGEVNYFSYCASSVIEEVRAYTYGELYHLSLGYPGMTTGQEKVEGFLLIFTDKNVLVQLDQLEDYCPQRSPQENEYQRCLIPVYDLSGKFLGKAWSYLMDREKIRQLGGVFLDSGWWKSS